MRNDHEKLKATTYNDPRKVCNMQAFIKINKMEKNVQSYLKEKNEYPDDIEFYVYRIRDASNHFTNIYFDIYEKEGIEALLEKLKEPQE